MERLCLAIVYILIAFASNALAIPSDAGIYSRRLMFEVHRHESLKNMKLQMKYFTVDQPNAVVVTLNSPFSLPPFDSLAPTPLPQKSPPFCEDAPPQTPHSLPPPPPRSGLPLSPPSGVIYSPHMPQPPPASPSGMIYSPRMPPPAPPSPAFQPNVPTRSLSPPPPTPPSISPFSPLSPLVPYGNISSPTPPAGPPPSPPHHNGPSPPNHASGPPSHGLSPPVFLPPVVFPPPSGPPPAQHGGKPRSSGAAWCVAKPTVPDPIIQQAMDYACGSGADCKSIQPSGHCYEPDTILAHASYAFNSYWQYTKVTGGTCDFGGTAMIVTVDPSFEGCKFVLNSD